MGNVTSSPFLPLLTSINVTTAPLNVMHIFEKGKKTKPKKKRSPTY